MYVDSTIEIIRQLIKKILRLYSPVYYLKLICVKSLSDEKLYFEQIIVLTSKSLSNNYNEQIVRNVSRKFVSI